MSQYPTYPAYKDSGVAWLGEIPVGWEVKRLRFSLITNPSKNSIELPKDALVSFVPMEAISEYGGIQLETERELEEIGSGYTYFAENDVVVAKITPCFENGKGAIARGLTNQIAFGTTELHVLRVGEELDAEFLFYLTISQSFRKLGESEMYGAGGQKRVPENFIKDFRVGLPPLVEQQAIARFLDRKTAQIDALIAKKESLLARLAEKRTARISQAITKGLDPTAPMKDSGIPWLGEIPRHWEVGLVKRYFSVELGKMLNRSLKVDNGVFKPYLRAANIHWGQILLDDVKEMEFTPYQLSRYRLLKGDLLVTEGGVTVGRSAIWQGELEECYYQNSINRVRSRLPDSALPTFLFYWMYFTKTNGYTDLAADIATFGHLTQEKLQAFPMVVPPLPEQQVIVQFLDEQLEKIARQTAKIEEAINKLKEYRTALITNAVTGKIDVRVTTLPDRLAAEAAHA